MIDFKNYYDILYRETKEVLSKVIEENRDEEIYGIGYYYSSPDWSYIMPCILTKKEFDEDLTLSDEVIDGKLTNEQFIIKWSYSERDSFEKYEEIGFEETDNLLREIRNHRYEASMDFTNDSSDSYIESIINLQNETALSVLENLKSEGFFDSLDLDNTIINMWWYEQENKEMLEWAKRLNTELAYNRLEAELLGTLEYDLSEFERDLYKKSKRIFGDLVKEESRIYVFSFNLYSNNRFLPLAFDTDEYTIKGKEREVYYDSLDRLNRVSTEYFILLDEYRSLGMKKNYEKLIEDIQIMLKNILKGIKKELIGNGMKDEKFYIWWNNGENEEKIEV